jgi:uncharacterized membrane protein YphA (DoxX/SURF4 family)
MSGTSEAHPNAVPHASFRGGAAQLWLSLAARLVLGGVLVVAGALKVSDPNAAIRAVTAYQLLPSDVATLVGYGLPFFEIMLGLLLIVGLATRASAATAGVLMVVFIAAVSSAWARGLSIDCGCFGGGGATEDPQYLPEILRDLLFLGFASWLVAFPASRWALDRAGLFGTGDHGLIDELLDDEDDLEDDEDDDVTGLAPTDDDHTTEAHDGATH